MVAIRGVRGRHCGCLVTNLRKNIRPDAPETRFLATSVRIVEGRKREVYPKGTLGLVHSSGFVPDAVQEMLLSAEALRFRHWPVLAAEPLRKRFREAGLQAAKQRRPLW
jgi:hypothetical protein